MEEAWPDPIRIIGLFVADVGYGSGRSIIINPSWLNLSPRFLDSFQMQHLAGRPAQAWRRSLHISKLVEMLTDHKIVIRMQDDQAVGCRGLGERGIREGERL